jgi:hypothetical protein
MQSAFAGNISEMAEAEAFFPLDINATAVLGTERTAGYCIAGSWLTDATPDIMSRDFCEAALALPILGACVRVLLAESKNVAGTKAGVGTLPRM